ncbi:phosphotransferase [Actinoplanes sp. TBRC 11911]|uniref:phosphotransferase family protein n=1 Tax=Actinoplanes sp. TBRC 11911 TaxID=2729386 RepID=UPI00145F44EA|nr:phosphotransferase [Actinoplanes sp. TBRC 11911]NMO51540.1 phosphotransferase [Actinoplanes sp. TBRC 11911]
MELKPRIRHWIETLALPGRKVATTRPLTGGFSNDNALVTLADGGEYVLRRYLRKNSAAVEAALAARLSGVVPVPEVIAADPSGGAAGEPALLSTFMPGQLLGHVLTDPPPASAQLGHAVGATLAALGSITFASAGFFSDGRLTPDGIEPTSDLDVFVERCLTDGNAQGHLSDEDQRKLLRVAERATDDLRVLRGSRQLVHSDFNPKNLLVARPDGTTWQVTAVLDWEFAFSSSPLVDIGNMLRDPRPPAFEQGFVDGFRESGGDLPADWRRLSQALDLFALADFLTRPPDHRYFRRAVRRIRELRPPEPPPGPPPAR